MCLQIHVLCCVQRDKWLPRQPLLTDTGLLDGGAGAPVPEVVLLTPLTVLALRVVPAVVTHPSMCPLAGGKHSWVEVTRL